VFQPLASSELSETPLPFLLEKVCDVEAPPAVIANNAIAFATACEPYPAFGAIGSGEAGRIGLVALDLDLFPHKA
jgi:hypothetical protein